MIRASFIILLFSCLYKTQAQQITFCLGKSLISNDTLITEVGVKGDQNGIQLGSGTLVFAYDTSQFLPSAIKTNQVRLIPGNVLKKSAPNSPYGSLQTADNNFNIWGVLWEFDDLQAQHATDLPIEYDTLLRIKWRGRHQNPGTDFSLFQPLMEGEIFGLVAGNNSLQRIQFMLDTATCEFSTSITPPSQNLIVNLIPNPTKDEINLVFKFALRTANIQITIIDIQGRRVSSKDHMASEVLTLNLAYLPEGAYWVEIVAGEDRVIKKVIKRND